MTLPHECRTIPPNRHSPIGQVVQRFPSHIAQLSSITATRNSVTICWEDPDDGNSEITGYTIFYSTGFIGEEKFFMNTEKPEFTHTELKPGTKYEYRIIPINMMGEADVQRTFEARTQSA